MRRIIGLLAFCYLAQSENSPRNQKTRPDGIFKTKPSDQFLTLGQQAVIKCGLESNHSDKFQKLQWVKDGFALGQHASLPGKSAENLGCIYFCCNMSDLGRVPPITGQFVIALFTSQIPSGSGPDGFPRTGEPPN